MQNTPNYANISNATKGYKDNGLSYPVAQATATVVPLPCPPAPMAKKKSTKKASDALKDQGYTEGLVQSISHNSDAFPVRIWVVDNSGSMSIADGHRLHQFSDNRVKLLDCTRWAEIKDTVTYHARMAALLEAPTTFWLLNPAGGCPQQFGVCEKGTDHIEVDLLNLTNNIRRVAPCGVTPLSDRVREIAVHIESMRDGLVANGQKAVVVLATDGVPTNGFGEASRHTRAEFKQALQSLEGLPVWLVIRLCTDDEEVVDFYNTIDGQLEFSLDVLDDFSAEALEVYEHNAWLNYALPLHRMREMGFYHKLFDLLDERPFTKDEIKEFALLLFGQDSLEGIQDPQIDWQRFLDRVADVNSKEKLQWNPVKNRMTPWIDIRKLDRKYGNKTLCSFW